MPPRRFPAPWTAEVTPANRIRLLRMRAGAAAENGARDRQSPAHGFPLVLGAFEPGAPVSPVDRIAPTHSQDARVARCPDFAERDVAPCDVVPLVPQAERVQAFAVRALESE